jgi:endonuclease YncB( thermonuclease family)
MLLSAVKRKSWQGCAQVESVHDGDTFTVFVDLGFGIFLRTKVRVQGVNSPETDTAAGRLAAAFLAELLPINSVVSLDSRRLDLHGRAEAVVALPDGRDLASVLLAAGQAQPANDRGNL